MDINKVTAVPLTFSENKCEDMESVQPAKDRLLHGWSNRAAKDGE